MIWIFGEIVVIFVYECWTPIHLYVGYGTILDKKIIEVDQITSFLLLMDPPQKWLNLIQIARNERAKVEDTWEDYIEPAWYHEVVKNKEYKDYLMKYFPQ